jgi:hypothetical protein
VTALSGCRELAAALGAVTTIRVRDEKMIRAHNENSPMPSPRNRKAKAELELLLLEREELKAELVEMRRDYQRASKRLRAIQSRIIELRRAHGPRGER